MEKIGKVIKIEIEDLVEKTKAGDTRAYEELMKIFDGDLRRIARTYVHNEEDVKDIVQLTFSSAYFSIHTLKDNKKFKSWLIKILVNKCKKLNKKIAKRKEISPDDDEYKNNYSKLYLEDKAGETIDFENLIKDLSEKEKQIFQMQYEEGMTTKEISKKLNMNENTIKTILSRGRLKLKKKIKPATIFLIILCTIATTVIGASIIKYIMGLFDTKDVGVDNDGILMAIEHMEWYQKVDMDYIDLGDGYKIKADYILMDEMNLYMVVDFESEKDISEYDYVTISDVKITNERGDVICDKENILNKQYAKVLGDKTIENNANHIKCLLYLYTDRFPESKILDINFSKIKLTKKLGLDFNKYTEIYSNKDFQIELSEKFINRKFTQYISDSNDIEKAIITETGFYAIIQNNTSEITKAELVDENGNRYKCYFCTTIFYYNMSNFKYFIISNFNNTESKELKLIFDNVEYELRR